MTSCRKGGGRRLGQSRTLLLGGALLRYCLPGGPGGVVACGDVWVVGLHGEVGCIGGELAVCVLVNAPPDPCFEPACARLLRPWPRLHPLACGLDDCRKA